MNIEHLMLIARDSGFQTGVIHDPEGGILRHFIRPIGSDCGVELGIFAKRLIAEERAKEADHGGTK